MSTALITHADALGHVTPEGHPERVARMEHALHAIQDLPLERVSAPEASDEELTLCHPQRYVDRIRGAIPSSGTRQLDADTSLSPGSMYAARRGAGGGLQAVDMVLKGEVKNAFVAMRPPGHHAELETPMGFCLFGNAAIAAKYALETHGLKRVAVVDFDVHHGNGTQNLLWDEARTLFVSSQQMPLWPGTGAATERGAHDNVLNLPLAPGSGSAEMRTAWEAAIRRIEAWAPELLIISAGFDAHQDDPLANLNWVTEDYRWITRELCAMAQRSNGGRVVSTLEGGYDLEALSEGVRAHVEVLLEAGS